ncbi:Hypothetical predicted protein, partial [Paramuricea clavata]
PGKELIKCICVGSVCCYIKEILIAGNKPRTCGARKIVPSTPLGCHKRSQHDVPASVELDTISEEDLVFSILDCCCKKFDFTYDNIGNEITNISLS